MDRIDLRVEVPAVSAEDLIRPSKAEASGVVAGRIARARKVQTERFTALGLAEVRTNAHCSTSLIEKIAEPDGPGKALMREASEKLGFSARAYHRVLKVARTLADLDDCDSVGRIHIAEAISYRATGPARPGAAP